MAYSVARNEYHKRYMRRLRAERAERVYKPRLRGVDIDALHYKLGAVRSNPPPRTIQDLASAPLEWRWVQGMYLAGNDCGVALRLNAGQDYEPQSRALWKKLCKDAPLVVDVGAHTGIYSLEAWQAGAKEVLSIECYHLNFARLVMNLRHAGFSAESCCFAAAGERSTIAQLSVDAPIYYCSAGASLDPQGNFRAKYPVNVRPLDSLLKPEYHAKVAVMKIDAERSGAAILRGARHILSYKPDLILECIETGMDELLTPLGYRFYVINERSGLHPVEHLVHDLPFDPDTPNRYATARDS